MVVPVCNPKTQGAEVGGHEFKASLGYIRPVSGHQWLTSVILATQEAEIRRIKVLKASLGKWFVRPYLKNTQHKNGFVEWLKC
jgi:hypothetical protein